MMNIIVNADRYVLSGLELLITSTMMHNSDIHWYVLTMPRFEIEEGPNKVRIIDGLTLDDEKWLRFIVQFMDQNSELSAIDCTDVFDQTIKNSPNNISGFGPFAALRLLADLIIPESECIYLDCDIIVQGDLSGIYHECTKMDIDYAAYCVQDKGDLHDEVVSAVMIFNLDHIRRSRFLERARYYYNRDSYTFPDQKALEYAGEPYHLPETYNYMREHRLAEYKPVILHFTNVNSPKIYHNIGDFYRHWPEHIKYYHLINMIREIYMK